MSDFITNWRESINNELGAIKRLQKEQELKRRDTIDSGIPANANYPEPRHMSEDESAKEIQGLGIAKNSNYLQNVLSSFENAPTMNDKVNVLNRALDYAKSDKNIWGPDVERWFAVLAHRASLAEDLASDEAELNGMMETLVKRMRKETDLNNVLYFRAM